MNRRSALRAITAPVAAAVASSVVSPALASESSAARVVGRINNKISDILETQGANSFQKRRLVKELVDMFRWALDVPAIAQSVLGPAWKAASKQQRQSFVDVFAEYLAAKYSVHFPRIVGAEFEILESSELKRKNHYLVLVKATYADNTSQEVRWYLLRRNGRSRVVNIAVGKTNILTVERKVIRSLLQQHGGDLDRLIAYLPERYEY